MMLSIDALRLRSITRRCQYGADIQFSDGLNIIQANNTSGKSTCLQAIIYALGLERSLGPRLEVPLPYAMRERIHATTDDDYDNVLQSYVELQVSNSEGETLVIHRDIEGGQDRKLIRTWNKPKLVQPDIEAEQRDFFVHDQGAAVREDGFHTYLAKFIGWDLPLVPKYDGSECPLYLETIFPMLFVEQKKGWSAIQGPFPTYLGIQDLPRRVLEFLLNLDASNIRRERADLRRQSANLIEKWRTRVDQLADQAGSSARITGVPAMPTAEFAHVADISIEIFYDDEWYSVDAVTQLFNARLLELEKMDFPETEDHAPVLQKKLESARERHDELLTLLETLRQDFSTQHQEHKAVGRRLEALDVDLKRNLDARKLQQLGSVLGVAAGTSACPTCHQEIEKELLPEISSAGMAIEENIAFVRSQIDLYRSAQASSTRILDDVRLRYSALEEELHDRQRDIRSLRQALIRPSESPSRAVIEEIIDLEARIERWVSLQERADEIVDDMQSIAENWTTISDRLKDLAGDELTTKDKDKLAEFNHQLRDNLRRYGFSSFQPEELILSADNFRPLVMLRDSDSDGQIIEREIGYELSGSDDIRLKWAYYLSLFAVSHTHDTKHPGLIIFDEPGQQRVKLKDFFDFIKRLADYGANDGQIVVATSEPLENVRENLSEHKYALVSFEGLILQPISD